MTPHTPSSETVKLYIRRRLTDAVENPDTSPVAPAAAKPWLDQLLAKADSYRDGALVLLAYQVLAAGTLDVRDRPEGARGVTRWLGMGDESMPGGLLSLLSIRGVKDAFQNVGKNTANLVRGNHPAWDGLLAWASDEASLPEVNSAFDYLLFGIARTAVAIPAMPELDVGRLTFARAVGLIEDLLAKSSGGCYPQFLVAALLDALLGERNGTTKERIQTKGINVSDASSGAGDVEHWVGGVVH